MTRKISREDQGAASSSGHSPHLLPALWHCSHSPCWSYAAAAPQDRAKALATVDAPGTTAAALPHLLEILAAAPETKWSLQASHLL